MLMNEIRNHIAMLKNEVKKNIPSKNTIIIIYTVFIQFLYTSFLFFTAIGTGGQASDIGNRDNPW